MSEPAASQDDTRTLRPAPPGLQPPANWKRLTAIGVGTMAVLALMLFSGRWLWDEHVRQKAHEKVASARQALGRHALEESAPLIREAMRVIPDDPALLRVMVDYLEQTGREPTVQLQVLKRLHELNLAQPGDAILAGHARLRLGDVVAARALWAALPQDLQDSAEGLKFKAWIVRDEGGHSDALKLQTKAVQKSADSQSKFESIVLDAQSSHPATAASGLKRLFEAAEQQDKDGLEALRLLLENPGLNATQVEHLDKLMQGHPAALLPDRLLALSALMRLHPERRASLMNEIVSRHLGDDIETKVAVARWLAGENDPGRLKKLVPEEALLRSKELFPFLVQSLAGAGHWEELDRLLSRRGTMPMTQEGLAVWRSLAASRLQQDMSEASRQLKISIEQASATKNYRVLLAAAKVAEEFQMWDLALEGYQSLTQPEAGREFDMLEKCWQMASRLGDSAHLLDTARRQSVLRPSSVYFANRLDYLRLLRGEEIEAAVVPSAQQAVDASEEAAATTLLSALKAYRLGDTTAVAEILPKCRDAAGLPVGQRAVYAGLLAFVGEASRAYQLAEKISSRLLVAEEQEFLKKAR